MSATIPRLGNIVARDHIQTVIEGIMASEFTSLIGAKIYEEPVPQKLQAGAGDPYPLTAYQITAPIRSIYDASDEGDALARDFACKIEVRDVGHHYARARLLYHFIRERLNKTPNEEVSGEYEGGRVNSCVEDLELPPGWRKGAGGEIYYHVGGLWTLQTQKHE